MVGSIVLGGIALVVFGIWLNWFIAKQFEDVAAEKGFEEKRNFWIPFFFGIVGYIMVAALPDRGVQTAEIKKEEKNNNFSPLFRNTVDNTRETRDTGKTTDYIDNL